jgi:lactate permease
MIEEANLPTDLGHWAAAVVPIVILLLVLVWRRWSAAEAAPLGMFSAAVLALIFFRTGGETLAVAAGKGIWDAVFILLVIWPALLLYRLADRAGAFDALRHGMTAISRSELFLVLAFGWGFASFMQGIAGFGAPIAVVAPLLVAIGVRPVYAVVIPLIGHAWANMFGTLGVSWLATVQIVDLEDELQTAFQTALLLWIANLTAGFAIAWLFGGMPAVWHATPLVLIVSAIHGGLQLVLALWNPILSNAVAATVGLLAFFALARWQRYREPAEGITEQRVMREESDESDADEAPRPVMGLGMALLPYVVLTVVAVGALAIPPVEATLERLEFGFPFPRVETGYDLINEGEDPYSPLTPLTHPGTFLLVAAVVAWLVYRARGYYATWARRDEGEREESGLLSELATNAVPASAAVVGFLVMSTVMDHAGLTGTLALGTAEVAPATVYTFLAAWIGILGAFMTSSNTASNVLFVPLQQTVASVEGLSQASIIGAQSAGGAIGNTIAPANVVLGTGTAGATGEEGQVLRKTLPWALAVGALVGVATIALNALGS